ncbi:MAG: Uma2 family endonuclease [Cyanobacteria bacterium J06621_3]
MTYTLRRYQSYQEYLDDDQLQPECDYRLLSTGELVKVSGEDDGNLWLASYLFALLLKVHGFSFFQLIRKGNKELQVHPVGDRRVNHKPDLLVMHPDHLQNAKQAITLGMSPPRFVAEVVSPGNESSDNYLRDYVWKRQQYEEWQIPEYWIIDPHREQLTVLILTNGRYQEMVYKGSADVVSPILNGFRLSVTQMFAGEI